MIALKPHPDLSSSSTKRDTLELRKQKTREKNNSYSIHVVSIFLILCDLSMGFKHNIGSILTNFLDEPINPLELYEHVNLLIGIVGPIEKRWFAGTMLHVTFVDHRPIKVK
jgi:hypothetical protein